MAPADTHEELWLLGQPPLQDYLDYVRKAVIGGGSVPPASLVDEWRAANDHYYELEKCEAGAADQIEVRELEPALRPMAAKVAATPIYRLLVHNGYHRACALRVLGQTHAPAVVQTVTRRDELNLLASREVMEMPVFYFKAARPPLLKDLFDPKLVKRLRVSRAVRVVEISFETTEFELKDFSSDSTDDAFDAK